MRRTTPILALVSLAIVSMATGASAASPYAGCPVGPTSAGGSTIGAWELWDQLTTSAAVAATGRDTAGVAPTFAREDKNNDGLLCMMVQVLPNDASGYDTYFVHHDNNAREK